MIDLPMKMPMRPAPLMKPTAGGRQSADTAADRSHRADGAEIDDVGGDCRMTEPPLPKPVPPMSDPPIVTTRLNQLRVSLPLPLTTRHRW